jgi:hypothetical protein
MARLVPEQIARKGEKLRYEDTIARLIELARENGGTVTARQVEADPELSGDRDQTSAAARALGGSTNVFSSDEPDDREWFPFSSLLFSELGAFSHR